ncbi:MAG: hypothetical protein LDL41_13235 [Coleofasciculus sp. S288]|nr:hypothetical protein [Coleofasciculus sp. S288]
MHSAKLGLLVLIGTVAIAEGKLNLQPSTAQAQTSANSLQIVSGMGRVTSSQYSAFVPIGTGVNQVSGSYNPSTRQIVLEIAGRQAELSLNSPLIDGKPVEFAVTQIKPRLYGEPTVEQFPKLVQDALISSGIESQGTLVKKGNQITGRFTSQGKFEHENQQGTGAVEGEFVLTVQAGGSGNVPQQPIQSQPSSNTAPPSSGTSGLLW